jgi:glucokinase
MSEKLILGVDVGGTKIAAAVVTDEGKVISRGYGSTSAQAGPQVVIDNIFATIDRTISSSNVVLSQLSGIGIAAAGIIDSRKGKVIFSPNLPGCHEVPLGDAVHQRFNVSTYLGNDASLAALGEWCFGVKKQVANLIYVTVSTGIGGGIICNGKPYTGVLGAAGEIGHMTIDVNGPRCNCGSVGCWETLASGTALAREAVKHIKEGDSTSIVEFAGGDLTRVDAKVVFEAAKQGDKLANQLIARLGYYLGVGLANVVNIFNPELILIGGGVAKMGDLLLAPAIKVVEERAFKTSAASVQIRPALLGDDSSILGAVAFVLDNLAEGSTIHGE